MPAEEELVGVVDLYRRLVRNGPVDIDHLPSTPGADDVDTLRDLGLATVRGRRLAPVPPTAAVARVLAARQQELAVQQDALRRAYRDLTRLRKIVVSRLPGPSAAWRVLPVTEAAELAADLGRAASGELLDVWTTAQALTDRPPGPAATSAAHRVVLDRRVLHSPHGEQEVADLGRHAAVRLAADVTGCLRLVDGRHVFAWPLRKTDSDAPDLAGDTGTGAAYVMSPVVATAVRGLFEVLWSGTPVGSRSTRPAELTATQWRILRLMASGMSDAALADATGATIRTVRSHVSAIMRVLGAPTRFAAGVAAVRRGWL